MTLIDCAKLVLENKPSCIFSRSGHLIWRSPAWNPDGREFTQAENDRVNGIGWHEFIEPSDLDRLLNWLASPDSGTSIVFSCMHSSLGLWHRVLWRKAPLDQAHWLVISATVTDLWEDDDIEPPVLEISQ